MPSQTISEDKPTGANCYRANQAAGVLQMIIDDSAFNDSWLPWHVLQSWRVTEGHNSPNIILIPITESRLYLK